MYTEYYGLTADPFRLTPDHAFCLPHRSFAKAKAYLRYALRRREGFVMITGAPGTGKTTLIDDLLAELDGSRFSLARLVTTQVEADDILRMVAGGFGLNSGRMEKSEILRQLTDRFSNDFKSGKRALLIVDEAQGLALSALEELRLLTNLHLGGEPLLQIFLVGQEELREKVTLPSLEQLNQRIIAACHIEPLQPDEFVAYVLHRLGVAGWCGNPAFAPGIFPELFRFSDGLPRRINHICSRLMLHGYLEEKQQLDAADIATVIRELRAEHYSIRENSALIVQERFNPDDLRRLAQTALTDAAVAASERTAKKVARPPVSAAQGTGACSASDQLPISPADAASWQLPTQALAEFAYTGTAGRTAAAERKTQRSWMPAWGLVAALLVGLTLLLVTLPSQQLQGVAKQALWNRIGLTRIRNQVSDWSGGRLPLREAEPGTPASQSPIPIQRSKGGAEEKKTLDRLKSAAELKEYPLPAAGSRRGELGAESPLLSESRRAL
ncbi:MAG: AAA family ATPase [Gammaproteobacteria bacterium]|nr:AAA family ATPase [Gammaproteobacteria bacterium]MCP5418716.1 AAA family ATPase [Chromatiaceae bacterium]